MLETQISAYISQTTKEQVEKYADAHGVKKGHLIEEALLHHMQALRELPADLVIPPKLLLTPSSFKEVGAVVKKARKPTAALRRFLQGKHVAGEP